LATYELVEVAKAVNRLRQSKGIGYLLPDEVLEHLKRTIQTSAGHKRKYGELLDRTEREARLRAEAKRVTEKLEREERTKGMGSKCYGVSWTRKLKSWPRRGAHCEGNRWR
jgi:hypothetical protein